MNEGRKEWMDACINQQTNKGRNGSINEGMIE